MFLHVKKHLQFQSLSFHCGCCVGITFPPDEDEFRRHITRRRNLSLPKPSPPHSWKPWNTQTSFSWFVYILHPFHPILGTHGQPKPLPMLHFEPPNPPHPTLENNSKQGSMWEKKRVCGCFSWKSQDSSQFFPCHVSKNGNIHVMCLKKIPKLIHKSHVICKKRQG